MNLKYSPGRYGEKDNIIHVTTRPHEKVTIFKLAFLVNQLAWNELEKQNGKGRFFIVKNGLHTFFFRSAIIEAIDMALQGINWKQEQHAQSIKKWAARYQLKTEDLK